MSNDLLAEAFAYQRELLDKENMTNSSYEKQQQEEPAEPSEEDKAWARLGEHELWVRYPEWNTHTEGPHGPNFTKYLEEINKE